jgi:DNA modification methylase
MVNKKEGYVNEILSSSDKYLKKEFNDKELKVFLKEVKSLNKVNKPTEVIHNFTEIFQKHIKNKFRSQDSPNYDKELHSFIARKSNKIKILWGDCQKILEKLPSESVHLMVTSPPYYNAREYSQWKNLNDYLEDMRKIIKECYRVIDNHRVFVFNVGDIFDNDNLTTKSVWGKRRLPLGAYFIKIFEECGFTFVDDYLWDKGEVQSERHKNGDNPYPFYIYPMNCYEHILIFHKHRLDKTRHPCPVCGSLSVSGNTQSEIGVQSWECKNNSCFKRSKSNRGKRFSAKNITTQNKKYRSNNEIEKDLITKWRRDITRFSPVIKFNSKGENTLGHTAPFPEDIPEMAIKFFTYSGDVVLDPFAGSFTTAIVANRMNRIGVGCELRKDLFEEPIKRNIKNKKMSFEEKELF